MKHLEDRPIPDWTVRLAAVRSDRIIVNAVRTQVDRRPADSTRQGTTLVIDTFFLPLNTEFHLVPARRVYGIQWKKRHGLQPVKVGLDPELQALYEVYARPDQSGALPTALVQALIAAHPVLSDQSAFCFLRGISLRLQPQCWGICTSNPIHRAGDMSRLIDVADAVSKALKPAVASPRPNNNLAQ